MSDKIITIEHNHLAEWCYKCFLKKVVKHSNQWFVFHDKCRGCATHDSFLSTMLPLSQISSMSFASSRTCLYQHEVRHGALPPLIVLCINGRLNITWSHTPTPCRSIYHAVITHINPLNITWSHTYTMSLHLPRSNYTH